MNIEHFRRRNAVSSVAVNPQDLFDYDTDSDKVSDILEDDLERGSAVLAAFVVTLITVTFFGTLVAMLSVTMSLSGDYQVPCVMILKTESSDKHMDESNIGKIMCQCNA